MTPPLFAFAFKVFARIENEQATASYASLLLLYKCSAVAEMGDRLVTIDMGRKLGAGAVPPFLEGSWVPI